MSKSIIRAYTAWWPEEDVTTRQEAQDQCLTELWTSEYMKSDGFTEDEIKSCGISEADQQRIFERFYRVENAVHTEVGTGLGLSIVRGILEKHGSQVFMVSEPDVGTTFWFDLPLAAADQDELALQAERQNRRQQNDLEEQLSS